MPVFGSSATASTRRPCRLQRGPTTAAMRPPTRRRHHGAVVAPNAAPGSTRSRATARFASMNRVFALTPALRHAPHPHRPRHRIQSILGVPPITPCLASMHRVVVEPRRHHGTRRTNTVCGPTVVTARIVAASPHARHQCIVPPRGTTARIASSRNTPHQCGVRVCGPDGRRMEAVAKLGRTRLSSTTYAKKSLQETHCVGGTLFEVPLFWKFCDSLHPSPLPPIGACRPVMLQGVPWSRPAPTDTWGQGVP